MRSTLLAATLLCAFVPLASAQDAMPGMSHDTTGEAPADFSEAMERMHAAMMTPPTGDVDVDFVRGMIAHHQGAIDMARIELAHGTDPEARAMAESVIEAQEREIAEMQAWLAARGD
jgi:uncharacterized protein (DUF305 family)